MVLLGILSSQISNFSDTQSKEPVIVQQVSDQKLSHRSEQLLI